MLTIRSAARPSHSGGLDRRRMAQCLERLPDDHRWLRSDDSVGAMGHGDRALGGRPERQARNPEDRGLFLDAAGIGQDQASATHEGDEVEVAERVQQVIPPLDRLPGPDRAKPISLAAEPLPDAWMHREHDGELPGHPQRREQLPGSRACRRWTAYGA